MWRRWPWWLCSLQLPLQQLVFNADSCSLYIYKPLFSFPLHRLCNPSTVCFKHGSGRLLNLLRICLSISWFFILCRFICCIFYLCLLLIWVKMMISCTCYKQHVDLSLFCYMLVLIHTGKAYSLHAICYTCAMFTKHVVFVIIIFGAILFIILIAT